jgi:alkyl hydroperoxide reductase subunit AhpC
MYYPMSVGRNIDELLRVVDALQTADTNHCSTPANCRRGDSVVMPVQAAQAARRRGKGPSRTKELKSSTGT